MPPSPSQGARSPTSYCRVDVPVYCVLTRIRLRHAAALPLMWWMYGKVKRETAAIPELKRSAFLVEGPRVCLILSLWEGHDGPLKFGTCAASHVQAARRAFVEAAMSAGTAEVWSTEWRICAVGSNLNWPGPVPWTRLLDIVRPDSASRAQTEVPV